MRPRIDELVALGPLPSSKSLDIAKLEKIQTLLTTIERPVTDEEARALVSLFGPDECFGLAWTLVHLIETAPGWPLQDCFHEPCNDWIRNLKIRSDNLRSSNE